MESEASENSLNSIDETLEEEKFTDDDPNTSNDLSKTNLDSEPIAGPSTDINGIEKIEFELSSVPARIKDKKEINIKDDWTLHERLELMKLVNIHGRDFNQVANKIKSIKGSEIRAKHFFTADSCEYICDLLIERTKSLPEAEHFFKAIGKYTERAHILWIRNYLEETFKKFKKKLESYSTDEELRNIFIKYFSTTIDKNLKSKFENVFSIIFKMIKQCSTFDQFEDIKKTMMICQKFIPKDELENSSKEEIRKKAQIIWMENLFKSELSTIPNISFKVHKLKSPQKISPVKLSPPKIPQVESPKSPKNEEIIEEPPSKKSKKATPSRDTKTPKTPKTPTAPPTIKQDQETPKIEKSKSKPIVAEMPVIPTKALIIKKNIAERSDTKVYMNEYGKNVKNSHTQTLLILVSEVVDGYEKKVKKQYQIFRPKSKPQPTKEKTRTIGCQTGPITLCADTIRWIDDQSKIGAKHTVQDITSKIFGSCLRSYSKFIKDKSVTISFLIHEASLTTQEVLKNRNHKCRMWFESLKNVDVKHYFYNPVRYEVTKYRRIIHHPMDLLTIEDLMTKQIVKDKFDMVIHVALITANGVVCNMIVQESRDFFFTTMRFMKDNPKLMFK